MNKGLEALERLRKGKATNSDVTVVKRELKALEIIKELPDKYKEGLNYILLNALNERKISQEKYDLLKEVLL